MHGKIGGEDAVAMVFVDRGSPCLGKRHAKAFQESPSSAGGEASGDGSSLFGCKHGVDQVERMMLEIVKYSRRSQVQRGFR